jgi:mannose-6-phosphate isomerase-like protein (cupin superfamily)
MQKVYQQLKDISPVITAHDAGKKFVFLSNDDTTTSITQFAYGQLFPGEECPLHRHQTMEECFYFITGEGEYVIEDVSYKIIAGTFVRIPVAAKHLLKAYGAEPLTFVYFGVATAA